jgi:hypothetical protein
MALRASAMALRGLQSVQLQSQMFLVTNFRAVQASIGVFGSAVAGDSMIDDYMFAASSGITQNIVRMSGANANEALAMSAQWLRPMLDDMTQFTAKYGKDAVKLFDAHHLLAKDPKILARLSELGLDPSIVHQPVFAMWIERNKHILMHSQGYNGYVLSLLQKIPAGDPARAVHRIADMLTERVIPDINKF